MAAADHPDLEPPDDVPAVSAEELVDGELTPEPVGGDVEEPGPRRYPSTIGGAFYLLVLALAATGIVYSVAGEWRTGIRILGGALLFAATVRVVLGNEDAGMLAVRHKAIDVTLLVATGVLLLVLASTIPEQAG